MLKIILFIIFVNLLTIYFPIYLVKKENYDKGRAILMYMLLAMFMNGIMFGVIT